MIGSIARLQLGRIEKRIAEHYDVPFSYSDDVVQLIRKRCTELESGGRMIDAILTNTVLPHISEEILNRMLRAQPVRGVKIAAKDDQFHYEFG
jgi:type VI secretion system protein VasG